MSAGNADDALTALANDMQPTLADALALIAEVERLRDALIAELDRGE